MNNNFQEYNEKEYKNKFYLLKIKYFLQFIYCILKNILYNRLIKMKGEPIWKTSKISIHHLFGLFWV